MTEKATTTTHPAVAGQSDPTNIGWHWIPDGPGLPADFYTDVHPEAEPGAKPTACVLNEPLAKELGLNAEALGSPAGVTQLAGLRIPDGTHPAALAYAGHQFGGFTMLGDGRACLLGRHTTPDSRVVDVQLKGSGRTPFSRGGDGRAALGPMLREHLIGEAMHALGIPTTRSLGVVTTGRPVYRETELPGAVLTRIADSHVRVGTFEYAARFVGPDALRALADHAIDRHFPELRDAQHPYRQLWHAIAERQADLVTSWMGVGFVHGVMNTDNVAISGQTIDYGPCAFMDTYDPATVFSSIDHHGRYAFTNQLPITHWNLARLAEAMLPLLADQPDEALAWARDAVEAYGQTLADAFLQVFRRKLGLTDEQSGDDVLIQNFLDLLAQHRLDFTNAFRAITDEPDHPTLAFFATAKGFGTWHERWSARRGDLRSTQETMRTANPIYIPRNHVVEAALTAAVDDNLGPYRELLRALVAPYTQQPRQDGLRGPAPDDAPPYRTFCGT